MRCSNEDAWKIRAALNERAGQMDLDPAALADVDIDTLNDEQVVIAAALLCFECFDESILRIGRAELAGAYAERLLKISAVNCAPVPRPETWQE